MTAIVKGPGLPDVEWDDFVAEMSAEATDVHSEETLIDRYLEEILRGENERMRNVATAKARINMIEDWREGENAKIERRRVYLVGQIGMLAPPDVDAMQAEHGKKSRSLPHGKFGFRQRADRVEIEDAKAAIAFALDNNLPVETTYSVKKTTLKEHAKSTGETDGEGWHMEPGKSEFFVTPAK